MQYVKHFLDFQLNIEENMWILFQYQNQIKTKQKNKQNIQNNEPTMTKQSKFVVFKKREIAMLKQMKLIEYQ